MATTSLHPELLAVLRRVGLGQIIGTLAHRVALPREQGVPCQGLLVGVLHDEVQRRDSSAASRRADDAELDPDMTLERFDGSAKIS